MIPLSVLTGHTTVAGALPTGGIRVSSALTIHRGETVIEDMDTEQHGDIVLVFPRKGWKCLLTWHLDANGIHQVDEILVPKRKNVIPDIVPHFCDWVKVHHPRIIGLGAHRFVVPIW